MFLQKSKIKTVENRKKNLQKMLNVLSEDSLKQFFQRYWFASEIK